MLHGVQKSIIVSLKVYSQVFSQKVQMQMLYVIVICLSGNKF